MRLAFLTACLRRQAFEQIVDWAASHGYTALEVACWPFDNTRDFSATTIDVQTLTAEQAAGINESLRAKGLVISSLGYYDNNLHFDPETRRRFLSHLTKVIDAARLLGVELVGTFVGRNAKRSVKDNLEEAEDVLGPIVLYAETRGRKLMIENCPMVGWQDPGVPGNLAYSPELWDELFARIPSDSFGLNFDPSHLFWLGIDHVQAMRDYRTRIFHAHAKDAELLDEGMYRYGILGSQLDTGHGGSTFWRYRLPGLGALDWGEFISTLYEIGKANGTVSVEHEDPVWSGSEDKVKAGLAFAARHLSQFIL